MKRAIFICAAALILLVINPLGVMAFDYRITLIGQAGHDLIAASHTGSFAITEGKHLILYDPSGLEVFKVSLPSKVKAMAFDCEGSLFVAYGATLAKFSSDEGKIWETEANDEIVAIAILLDGNPVVGHSYGIQAFSSDGKSLWEYYPHEECDF